MKPIKGFLPSHVRASREKERKVFPLILSLSFSFSQLSSLIFFSSLLYIKVKIFFISTTLICIIFVLVLQQLQLHPLVKG